MAALFTIAPVFLLIVPGAVLRRTGAFSEAFFRECSRLAYWVGLPCVLFSSIATSSLRVSWQGPLVGAMLGATTVCLLVAKGVMYVRAPAVDPHFTWSVFADISYLLDSLC